MGPLEVKTKLATVWLGGCSGCHMSLLDMDERLLALAPFIELRASPLTDYKDFPEVDVTLVEGAVANEEHVEHIRHVRGRTKVLVSLGDCAVTGNVTAMRNAYGIDEVLDLSYRQNATVVIGIPEGSLAVPRLLDRVLPVHEVVRVDYFLPGCPPDADAIFTLLKTLIDGTNPTNDGRRFG